MARQPFEYGDGCDGPEVNIDIIPDGFPVCTPVVFEKPKFLNSCIDLELIDLVVPPACPCFPERMGLTDGSGATIGCLAADAAPTISFDAAIVNVNPDDCCEPEFKLDIQLDINIPCPVDVGCTTISGEVAPIAVRQGNNVAQANLVLDNCFNPVTNKFDLCCLELSGEIVVPCPDLGFIVNQEETFIEFGDIYEPTIDLYIKPLLAGVDLGPWPDLNGDGNPDEPDCKYEMGLKITLPEHVAPIVPYVPPDDPDDDNCCNGAAYCPDTGGIVDLGPMYTGTKHFVTNVTCDLNGELWQEKAAIEVLCGNVKSIVDLGREKIPCAGAEVDTPTSDEYTNPPTGTNTYTSPPTCDCDCSNWYVCNTETGETSADLQVLIIDTGGGVCVWKVVDRDSPNAAGNATTFYNGVGECPTPGETVDIGGTNYTLQCYSCDSDYDSSKFYCATDDNGITACVAGADVSATMTTTGVAYDDQLSCESACPETPGYWCIEDSLGARTCEDAKGAIGSGLLDGNGNLIVSGPHPTLSECEDACNIEADKYYCVEVPPGSAQQCMIGHAVPNYDYTYISGPHVDVETCEVACGTDSEGPTQPAPEASCPSGYVDDELSFVTAVALSASGDAGPYVVTEVNITGLTDSCCNIALSGSVPDVGDFAEGTMNSILAEIDAQIAGLLFEVNNTCGPAVVCPETAPANADQNLGSPAGCYLSNANGTGSIINNFTTAGGEEFSIEFVYGLSFDVAEGFYASAFGHYTTHSWDQVRSLLDAAPLIERAAPIGSFQIKTYLQYSTSGNRIMEGGAWKIPATPGATSLGFTLGYQRYPGATTQATALLYYQGPLPATFIGLKSWTLKQYTYASSGSNVFNWDDILPSLDLTQPFYIATVPAKWYDGTGADYAGSGSSPFIAWSINAAPSIS